MKALLINDDSTLVPVDMPDEGTRLTEFYGFLDCRSIACVRLPGSDPMSTGVDLWVDDEGLLVDTPQQNLLASSLAGQPIYGHALLMRHDGPETASLLAEDVTTLLEGGIVIGPAFTVEEVAESRADGFWHLDGKTVKAAERDELEEWFTE